MVRGGVIPWTKSQDLATGALELITRMDKTSYKLAEVRIKFSTAEARDINIFERVGNTDYLIKTDAGDTTKDSWIFVPDGERLYSPVNGKNTEIKLTISATPATCVADAKITCKRV